MGNPETWRKAETVFKKHGGMLRTSRAVALGVHPRVLYGLRDAGRLEEVSRGLYRLADLPGLSNPSLTAVAVRIPNGVLCLISALAFHEVTTQIPHEVYVAVSRGTKRPRLEYPPIRLIRLSPPIYSLGIETHRIDNVDVRVYSVSKTVVDCFRFRNRVGLDVALEALRECWRARRCTTDELWRMAKICRVQNVMRPYLEAIVA